MPDAFRLPLAHAAGSSKLVPSPLTRMKQRIFISPPHPSGLEQHFIAEAFRSGWLTGSGPNVTAFETEFAKRMGIEASQAVALVSGTAALHLAMVSCGVGPGDEVLAPTFTFCASVNPVLYMGATPVLLDIEERSWNLDPALLEETLERKARAGRLPKAVVVAHSYGQPADLAPVRQACDRHGVKLVEDAASSLGASYCGQSLGTLGDFGAFSFNGNKVITTTGGGMLVVRDGTAAEHLRKLASQARDPAPHYQHSELGYNYRLSNVLAGIGRAQFRVLDERVRARQNIFSRYVEMLGDLPGLSFMPRVPWGSASYWLTCIQVDPDLAGTDREALRLALEADDIESRPVWKPMHQQPLYAGCECVGGAVAERIFERGLCLPSGSTMSEEDQERVVDVLRRAWVPARARKIRAIRDASAAPPVKAPLADDPELRRLVEAELHALRPGMRSAALIGTTARTSQPFSILPRREFMGICCASFLVGTAEAAAQVLRQLDGRVEFALVDVERKKEFDPWTLAGSILRKTRRVSYKPNDATLTAADEVLRRSFEDDLAGKNILIVGLGNLGGKLALRLAERGAHVYCVGRDAAKVGRIAGALSELLPRHAPNPLRALASIEDLDEAFIDALVTFVSESGVVGESLCRVLKPGALALDGGINNFRPDFFPAAARMGVKALRLDVRLGAPFSLLGVCGFTEHFFAHVLGHGERNGLPVVAGGFVGRRGDIILDSIDDPQQVIGIANGTGGLVPSSELTPDDKTRLTLAQSLIRRPSETPC